MAKNNPNQITSNWLAQLESVFVTLKPVTDEQLAIIDLVKNNTDPNYLQKLEVQLQQAKQKAEEADLIKTEFIQNIQHSIRTPFSGVWGLANILYELETDPQKKEYLGNISNCAKELLDYCNSILDFSKASLGLVPIISRKFKLKELVDKTITKVMPKVKCKGLEFVLNFLEDVPDMIIGDDYRLHEVLLHLVNNAIKFTSEGCVNLTVKSFQKNKNQENILQEITLQFIVEDTGIGIPEEKQQYIYEQFTRLTPSNKGIYKGLGLGLTFVKQFIEELHGEIDVTSQQGKGSTFICTIPFKLPLIN